jgi:putative hydrolase of the HAD superfamily
MPRISTVLIDAGGVLLLPSITLMRAALRSAKVEINEDQLVRAHYAATAVMDAHGGLHRDLYRRAFARTCGVPQHLENAVVERIARTFTGFDWTWAVPGIQKDLRSLLAARLRVGVVSNSTGTVDQMLAAAGICQVGPGAAVPVEVIVDSGRVGVAKPDPRIFNIALEALGINASEAVYVGDTARADVDGAVRAGLHPIHLDPYGDCPDPPGRHRHIRRLGDVDRLLRS